MPKFRLTVDSNNLAAQIVDLLNAGGQLWYRQQVHSVLYSPVKYVVELDKEKLIGVVGVEKFGRVSEIKHLCVHPEYRRQGLGKKLLEKGIEAATTEFIFGAVGSDNHSNIRNNLRLGMRPIGKRPSRGRYIIIFARRKNAQRHIHTG